MENRNGSRDAAVLNDLWMAVNAIRSMARLCDGVRDSVGLDSPNLRDDMTSVLFRKCWVTKAWR
jgi:hypothetical protein